MDELRDAVMEVAESCHVMIERELRESWEVGG
jgi:hypothetical protein